MIKTIESHLSIIYKKKRISLLFVIVSYIKLLLNSCYYNLRYKYFCLLGMSFIAYSYFVPTIKKHKRLEIIQREKTVLKENFLCKKKKNCRCNKATLNM